MSNDTWLTPKDFYERICCKYGFDDFDPCPPDSYLLEFDGLTVPWAETTYCNPPYSRELKDRFIRKGYEESTKGKLVVMLLPVATSSKTFHEVIKPYGAIEFLRGRLAFEGIDGSGNWVNPGTGWNSHLLAVPCGARTVKQGGKQDLMLVTFYPR